LQAQDLSWIAGQSPAGPYPRALAAKTRYRQADAACRIMRCDAQGLVLDFDQAQWAVTPGQFAVLYDGEVCLGGGVINRALQAEAVTA
jgi:tRNA-specific 2-thiouridylase